MIMNTTIIATITMIMMIWLRRLLWLWWILRFAWISKEHYLRKVLISRVTEFRSKTYKKTPGYTYFMDNRMTIPIGPIYGELMMVIRTHFIWFLLKLDPYGTRDG